MIRQGAGASAGREKTWAQIRELIMQRTRCSAAAHKRQIDLRTLVPADAALMLFRATLETTKEVIIDRVTDPRQASELFREVSRRVQSLLPAPTIPDSYWRATERGAEPAARRGNPRRCFDVPDRRALGTSACARSSVRPKQFMSRARRVSARPTGRRTRRQANWAVHHASSLRADQLHSS